MQPKKDTEQKYDMQQGKSLRIEVLERLSKEKDALDKKDSTGIEQLVNAAMSDYIEDLKADINKTKILNLPAWDKIFNESKSPLSVNSGDRKLIEFEASFNQAKYAFCKQMLEFIKQKTLQLNGPAELDKLNVLTKFNNAILNKKNPRDFSDHRKGAYALLKTYIEKCQSSDEIEIFLNNVFLKNKNAFVKPRGWFSSRRRQHYWKNTLVSSQWEDLLKHAEARMTELSSEKTKEHKDYCKVEERKKSSHCFSFWSCANEPDVIEYQAQSQSQSQSQLFQPWGEEHKSPVRKR